LVNILIVEDDTKVLTSLERSLSSSGFNVFTSNSVDSALEIIGRESLDVIVSDIMMKPRSGYELMEELMKNPPFPPIPVIFLTAKTEYEDFRKGMDLGAADYLTKPFTREQLINSIKTQLKKSEQLKENFNIITNSFRYKLPHQLRTPLVSILGFSEFINDAVEDEDLATIREYGSKIKASAKNLYKNIEKLLDFSEIITILLHKERSEITKRQFNFISIGEAIEIISGTCARNYNRENDNDTIVNYNKIFTHDFFFEKMLKEIIDNAYKYSARQSKVRVRGKTNDNYYIILVENESNEKIDLSTLTKPDDYFKNLKDNPLSTNGTGLGVGIAMNIAELLGCKITYEVNDSKIVRCYIRMPQTEIELNK